jgi:hypothetical protein
MGCTQYDVRQIEWVLHDRTLTDLQRTCKLAKERRFQIARDVLSLTKASELQWRARIDVQVLVAAP